MATVNILRGTFRKETIRNKTFSVIKGIQLGTMKGEQFITVPGKEVGSNSATARIYVKAFSDYVIFGNVAETTAKQKVQKSMMAYTAELSPTTLEEVEVETDEQIINRINRRFEIFDKMTMGAADGTIRSLIATGAPGVGKSFGVTKILDDIAIFNHLGDGNYATKTHEIVSGAISAVGLYMKLYQFRYENNVIVFDDCDIFNDENVLNLMKAALDTSKKRTIHWNLQSISLKKEDIPHSFDFNGSVIFITNKDFKKVSKNLKPHVEALLSRSHFLDLTISTTREKMLRIKDLVENKRILDKMRLDIETQKKLMQFLDEHKDRFNELSIRTIIKLAGLAMTFSIRDEWKEVATMSLLDNKL
jgi:hypothetical protein